MRITNIGGVLGALERVGYAVGVGLLILGCRHPELADVRARLGAVPVRP